MHNGITTLLDRLPLDLPELGTDAVFNHGGKLSVTLARWPKAAPFALFLSHDVDQIHDRELFRLLADVNHVRRRCFSGENGNVGLALQRIGRSLLRPKAATRDFETILKLEARHGFRSTFFLLHDRYWARQGSRYSFDCQELRHIANAIIAAGSELGVHGGYYRFNDATLYRESIEAVEQHFGVRPCGIRNHLLRFSGVETWRAQAEAGFAYDATYGWADRIGPRDSLALPFYPSDLRPLSSDLCPPSSDLSTIDLLELPLTVMDTTLFRYLKLEGSQALETAWDTIARVRATEGLVTLLWHNNYFNEPEYRDWQLVYEILLSRLAALTPWCATGAEINQWWRARAALVLDTKTPCGEHWRFEVHAPQPIDDVVLTVRSAQPLGTIAVAHQERSLKRVAGGFDIYFPHLKAGDFVPVTVGMRPDL